MSRFIHPETGWSIEVPEGWQRYAHEVALFLAIEPESDDELFRMNANVVAQVVEPGTTAETYTHGQIDALVAANPTTLVIDATPEVGDSLCELAVATVEADETRLTTVQRHVLLRDDLALIATVTVDTFEFGIRRAEVSDILSSLEVPRG